MFISVYSKYIEISFRVLFPAPWGEEFWTDGYFASTAGKHGDENMTGKYVKNQGKEYKKLHEDRQLVFF